MPDPKSRTVLSLDSVVTAALATLDGAGIDELSVRGVARRLDAGVASLYWYVKSKDELIDLAVDRVMADAIEPLPETSTSSDPLVALRELALRLFDAFDVHPWCPARVVQDRVRQPHTVVVFDIVGQQLARLGLSVEQQFHAATAVLGFVVGSSTRAATARRRAGIGATRDAYLADTARDWSAADPETLPFLHSIAGVMRDHDDREQFEFGVGLLLAGVRDLAT